MPDLWNKHTHRAKGKTTEAAAVNRSLLKIEDNVRNCIAEYGSDVNAIIKALAGGEPEVFSTFAQKWVAEQIAVGDLKDSRKCKSVVNKVEAFTPDLCFSKLNYEWIQKYRAHLAEKGNATNTINRDLKFIRAVVREAMRRGIVKKYPFEGIKIVDKETKRSYLSIEQLQQLDNLYNEKQGVADGSFVPLSEIAVEVLRQFLFCCWSGLRYSDAAALSSENISDKEISLKLEKGQNYISIPISRYAKKYLQNKQGKQFLQLANQTHNDHLKIIMYASGLDIWLTTHVARHTFATNALAMGIPLEVVQKLLGHKSIKTTQIYAKITAALKQKYMDRFDAGADKVLEG